MPSQRRYFVDEFVTGLVKLTIPRRQALLFALEMQSTLTETMNLCWPEVLRRGDYSGLSSEILRDRNRCRHIKLTYVFWEELSPRVAGPLLHLGVSAEKAFGMPWEALRDSYASMLMIDRQAEARDFMAELASSRQRLT